MNNNKINFSKSEKLATVSAAISALLRILPHPPNFTPVAGLSIYAGARMKGPFSWILPLILMIITDFILSRIHGYDWFSAVTPFVYGALILNVGIGTFLRETESPVSIGSSALLGSLLFFLITNTGVWMVGGIYEHSATGFLSAIIAGIPFYQFTLIGDLVFTGILFGSHHLVTSLREGIKNYI